MFLQIKPSQPNIQSLCEQVILCALRRESVPEFKPTRPRLQYFPRTAYFKRARVNEELERMIAHARQCGLSVDSVESVH